ncbi:MAG: hypothetical protein M3M88_06690 [Thermoproteota archaeon]|nr:hypothetical protein [Thermoproteota archaeon]
MKKLSDNEQQLLLQLIKSFEYYHLSEKQPIGCMIKILKRNISRRTCCLYKRKLYSHDLFRRLKESTCNSNLDKMSLLLVSDDTDCEVRAKVNKLIADQFPDKQKPSFLLPTQYCDRDNENMKDKVKDVIAKNRHFKEREKLSKEMLHMGMIF